MKKNYDRLITFDSTHQALQLEAVLDRIELDFDIRPIPPSLSAGCGLAIEFYSNDIDKVIEAIASHQIISNAMYQKKDKLYIGL